MQLNKLVAGMVLATAAVVPAAYADDHGEGAVVLPTEQEVRETGAQMKQAGKEKGQQMKQAGKETGAAAKQSGKAQAEQGKQRGEEMKQQGKATAASARESAEATAESAQEAAEAAAESGEAVAEEARKVPPGMEKREQHPSTGKGSEQGQESRQAEEKPWWRFWN
jgi:hypothetical protein